MNRLSGVNVFGMNISDIRSTHVLARCQPVKVFSSLDGKCVLPDNILNNAGHPSTCVLNQMRNYNSKKTKKILPTKELNFDFGGDLTKEDYPVNLSKPRLDFDKAEELGNINETVKKLVSIEFGDGQQKQKRRIHDLLSKVQEHPLDVRSLEVVIAYQTVAIRNQMRHVLRFRKDKSAKALLVLRLQARRKHMRRLRASDQEKFLWLCEELRIKYIPVPEYNRKPSKRATLKKAARNAAFVLKKQKMEEFKEKLEEEKKAFDAEKELELFEIEKEIKELQLSEDTDVYKMFYALKVGDPSLVQQKKTPPKSRRQLILLEKFRLAELRAKEREAN